MKKPCPVSSRVRFERASDLEKRVARAIERQYHRELGPFPSEPFEPWTMLSFARAALRAVDRDIIKQLKESRP